MFMMLKKGNDFMESEKINLGDSYCILSRYGQKFNLNQVLNNEIDI